MLSREHLYPVLVLQVLQAVSSLSLLAGHWPNLGGRVEEVRLALGGHAGVTPRQLQDLLEAARRWESMDPRLHLLYVRNIHHGAVQACAWVALFQDKSQTPSGACYGVLRSMWVDLYGYAPPIELVPTPQGSNP